MDGLSSSQPLVTKHLISANNSLIKKVSKIEE